MKVWLPNQHGDRTLYSGRKAVSRMRGIGIWLDTGVTLDENVSLLGPMKIGAHTRIGPDTTIQEGVDIRGHCAVVGGAVIGRNTMVGHSTILGYGATIGHSSSIWPSVGLQPQARLGSYAVVETDYQHMVLGPLGRNSRALTAHRHKDGGLMFATGCFEGSDVEFASAVLRVHEGSKHLERYMAALALARISIAPLSQDGLKSDKWRDKEVERT